MDEGSDRSRVERGLVGGDDPVDLVDLVVGGAGCVVRHDRGHDDARRRRTSRARAATRTCRANRRRAGERLGARGRPRRSPRPGGRRVPSTRESAVDGAERPLRRPERPPGPTPDRSGRPRRRPTARGRERRPDVEGGRGPSPLGSASDRSSLTGHRSRATTMSDQQCRARRRSHRREEERRGEGPLSRPSHGHQRRLRRRRYPPPVEPAVELRGRAQVAAVDRRCPRLVQPHAEHGPAAVRTRSDTDRAFEAALVDDHRAVEPAAAHPARRATPSSSTIRSTMTGRSSRCRRSVRTAVEPDRRRARVGGNRFAVEPAGTGRP